MVPAAPGTAAQNRPRPPLRRDIAFSLSLANLCFLHYWDEFLDKAFSYYTKTPPGLFLQFVTLLDILLLGAVFFGVAQFVRRFRRSRFVDHAAHLCLLALLVLLPLNIVRKDFLHLAAGDVLQSGRLTVAVVGLVALSVLSAVAYLLWRKPNSIYAGARAVVLILTPLLPITIVQTLWSFSREQASGFQDKPPAPPLSVKAGRVVVVVFDEMDYGLTAARPSAIAMPEWERLRRESIDAMEAYSPAPATLEAIPSLVTGRQVITAKPQSADRLDVQFPGADTPKNWRETDTIFSEARREGWNIGVSGWYHPYCRLFGDSCVSCFWTPAAGVLHREESIANLGIAAAMSVQLRRTVMEIPLLSYVDVLAPRVGLRNPGVRKQERLRAREEYLSIHEHALKLVSDPALNIVYLHYPIPHLLAIYDRKGQTFSDEDGSNYFDNLSLVERTIRELRSSLEKSGLWDATALLITSDHPGRIKRWREEPAFWDVEVENVLERSPARTIPFIFKLQDQKRGVQYTSPMNSVVMKELVFSVLRREVATPEQMVEWLDRNRSKFTMVAE